jgi:hypothetical protein
MRAKVDNGSRRPQSDLSLGEVLSHHLLLGARATNDMLTYKHTLNYPLTRTLTYLNSDPNLNAWP